MDQDEPGDAAESPHEPAASPPAQEEAVGEEAVGQDDVEKEGAEEPSPPPRVRRRFLPRNVKITLMVLLLFFIGEYILLPELASARRELNQLTHLNFLWLIAGVLFEVAD